MLTDKQASVILYGLVLLILAGFTFLMNGFHWDDEFFYHAIGVMGLAIACRAYIERGD